MKKLIFLLFTSIIGYSQVTPTSGFVEYGIDIPDSVLQKIKKNKSREDNKQAYNTFLSMIQNHKKIYSQDIVFLHLNFNKDKYLSRPVDIMLPESLKGKFIFKSDAFYGNSNTNTYLKQFKKQGNTYITPINAEYEWEITNDQKNILGFNCKKAIIEISKKTDVVAWFTPQIPVAFSPVKYYGLPGAILEAKVGFKHIYAKNIEFKDDVKIKKPTDGIKLSAKEYQEMFSRFKPD